jgi:hypothetical protein
MESKNEAEARIEIYFLKHFWIVLNQLLEEIISEIKQRNIKVNIH